MRFLILPLLILTTACSTINSRPYVSPKEKLFSYSHDFQQKVLAEESKLPPVPCARDSVDAGCSAVRRIIQDDHYNRDQMRAAGIQETP